MSLVEAGLSGDRKALEELVGYYYGPVYKVAFRILNDPEATADVTQTTFLSAFENLGKYDPAYKFFSWICRIAVNHALEHSRKRVLSERKRHLQVVPDEGIDPEQERSDEEQGREVSRVLMEMPEDYRIVLVLRHYSELSYEEIAEVLAVPVKTVRSRLYTARQQIKLALLQNGYEI